MKSYLQPHTNFGDKQIGVPVRISAELSALTEYYHGFSQYPTILPAEQALLT